MTVLQKMWFIVPIFHQTLLTVKFVTLRLGKIVHQESHL